MPALLAVLRVRTSQYDVVDSGDVQATMLLNWIRKTALPVVAILAAAAIAAPVVIPVVDAGRYPDSIPVFQLLLVVALCQYATMPSPNLLMAQRRFRLLALLYACALVVNAAVAVPAALAWGVVGVAFAAAVVGAAENLSVAFLVLQRRTQRQA